MRGRRGAKYNPRDYGIARNFGSGLRDLKTLLGTPLLSFSLPLLFQGEVTYQNFTLSEPLEGGLFQYYS